MTGSRAAKAAKPLAKLGKMTVRASRAQAVPKDDYDEGLQSIEVAMKEFLDNATELQLKICRLLIGRQRTFGELRRLTGVANDNNVTVALKRLRQEGLVERAPNPGGTEQGATYHLTETAVDVYLEFNAKRRLDALLNSIMQHSDVVIASNSRRGFEVLRSEVATTEQESERPYLTPYKPIRRTMMASNVPMHVTVADKDDE